MLYFLPHFNGSGLSASNYFEFCQFSLSELLHYLQMIVDFIKKGPAKSGCRLFLIKNEKFAKIDQKYYHCQKREENGVIRMLSHMGHST